MTSYLGIIIFHGGSILVDFVGTSHPQIFILHELINLGYKVISPFLGVMKYTKLHPYEPVKFK